MSATRTIAAPLNSAVSNVIGAYELLRGRAAVGYSTPVNVASISGANLTSSPSDHGFGGSLACCCGSGTDFTALEDTSEALAGAIAEVKSFLKIFDVHSS